MLSRPPTPEFAWILALLAIVLVAPALAAAADIHLSWQDTAINESGFQIERLIGSSYVPIATVATNVQSYTDSGLTPGATYCYRVRAYNSAGASSPSNLSCATTLATSSTTSTGGGSASTNAVPTTQLGSKWSDYRLALTMRSNDKGSIGVMFHYQDNDNYYRFSWSNRERYRRLEKRTGGAFRILAQDAVMYKVGRVYRLEIIVQGSSLNVVIDGAQIFAVTDPAFAQGSIALYSHANSQSRFDDVVVEDLVTHEVLLSDNFDDGNFTGWTMIDDAGTASGPSSWSAASGSLLQTSPIGSNDAAKLGTFALYTKGSWRDYKVTLKMRSTDDDALGVMFRFQDRDNYYRFAWDQERPGRHLLKRENGVFKVLAEDSVPYVSGRTYLLEIIVRGNALEVSVDGVLIFAVTDTSFDGGTVALFSWFNQGSYFDDILVEDLTTGALLLWDDFNNGDFVGWTIMDEGIQGGPSVWSVLNGTLAQTGNTGSDPSSNLGTFVLY